MKGVRDIRENSDRVFRDKSEEIFADGTTDSWNKDSLTANSKFWKFEWSPIPLLDTEAEDIQRATGYDPGHEYCPYYRSRTCPRRPFRTGEGPTRR